MGQPAKAAREAGYYVDATDWPAVPYPDDYPSADEIYKALAGFDEDWVIAMAGLARVRVPESDSSAEVSPATE